MKILDFFRNKGAKKVLVNSHIIDGNGFVTSSFEYPYKIIVFVYNDCSVEKRIVLKEYFSEEDKFFYDKEPKRLYDCATVLRVLKEAIRRCGLKEYRYEYDSDIMKEAREIVKGLRSHSVRFIHFEGDEEYSINEIGMNEVQYLYYVKLLNAEHEY